MKILLCIIIIFSNAACTHLFFHPDRKIYSKKDLIPTQVDEYFFKTKDNETLHGWYLHSQSKVHRGKILFFHGNAQNLTAHVAYLYPLLGAGYDFFIIDYRGYGSSSGEISKDSVSLDTQAAHHFFYKTFINDSSSHYILYGHSLGGALALNLLTNLNEQQRKKISVTVIDSGFASFSGIAREKLSSSWITWLFQPLAYLLVSDKLSSYNELPELKPMQYIVSYSEGDGIVPASESLELYGQLPDTKQIIAFPNDYHGSAPREQRFIDLLGKTLEKTISVNKL